MSQVARLTKRSIDAAKPGQRVYAIWDAEVSGFGIKIHPSGRKTYIFKYRVGGGRAGRRREPVLGVHGAITPDQARRQAIEMAHEVAQGRDPAAVRQEARQAPTMSELFERYLSEHAKRFKKPSSIRNDERIISKTLVPAFGRVKVREVTREDISSLHSGMADRPYEANRTLALLSKLFNLAELWAYREDGSNPCRHVKRYREERRERLLSEQELARLGSTLAEAERHPILDEKGSPKLIFRPALHAIRLLLFTGARSGEVLGLKWAWINWELRRAELPDSKTGRKFIYLPPPAMEVLDGIRSSHHDREFVIAGKKPGTHLVNLKDPWSVIRQHAGIEDVRIHDLRHCFASVGAMRGMSLPMIGALLGHKDVATTQRYAHLSDNPVRTAADEIGSLMSGLLLPPDVRDNQSSAEDAGLGHE